MNSEDLKKHFLNVIKSQWHPVKNLPLTFESINPVSTKKAWWFNEECGHEWEQQVKYRTKGKVLCVYCGNQKILLGFNDLATTHPNLASEWHPTRNNNSIPEQFSHGSGKKIWWQCDKGHEWENSILNRTSQNQNCPYCGNQKAIKGTNDLATTHPKLEKFFDTQANEFKLGEIKLFSKKSSHIMWKCEKGHTWKQSAKSLIKTYTCNICEGREIISGINDVLTLYPFILPYIFHSDKKELSHLNHKSVKIIRWRCFNNLDHIFTASIRTVIRHKTCLVCSNKQVLKGYNDISTTNPIMASHWHSTKNFPLKPEDITRGSGKRIWWQCDKGHEWEAYVYNKTNISCPQCYSSRYVSIKEKEIADWLKKINIGTIHTTYKKFKDITELDIYIPEKNIAVEYNGVYWHSDSYKDKNYHYKKWLACKNKGIQLIQIWEDDWNRNPELIKRMLAHKLGLSRERTIYARQTLIKEISQVEIEQFLNTNHVQGFASGSYYLGLFDKRDIEKLVAVLVLKKEPGTNGKTLNIIRYATSQNVVGGFTKLLSYAEKTYEPDSFITFSDNCVSDGGLYENNGFIADKELAPDYTYLVKGERKHKFGYRLKRFSNDPELQYQPGLTERELAALNGLHRVWDAGKTRWVKNV